MQFQDVGKAVIDPIDIDTFFSTYWEKETLHIERSNTTTFEHYINKSTIENLLSTQSLSFPQLQVTQAGNNIAAQEYTDENGQILGHRVAELHRNGATIVLSHAQKLHEPLMEMCRQSQKTFFMPCQANIYLSPPGKQGFNPHFDTHDVFILQVSGSKTFRFYSDRTLFPDSQDRFDKEKHSVGHETDSIILTAGDTLYIPRGVVHDAVASSTETSMHITLGVYPILQETLLHQLISQRSANNHEFRQAIPQNVWTTEQSPDRLSESLRELVLQELNAESVQSALDELRDSMALEAGADASGALSADKSPLQTDSKVKVLAHKVLHVEKSHQGVKVRLYGSVAEFDEPLASCVIWALSRDGFSVSDFQDKIDDEASIALVDQLRAYGLVEPV